MVFYGWPSLKNSHDDSQGMRDIPFTKEIYIDKGILKSRRLKAINACHRKTQKSAYAIVMC